MALVQRLVPVWKKLLGDSNVVLRDPEMGGEDFSLYGLQEPNIPIFLFRVGTVAPEKVVESRRGGPPLPSLHSAEYGPVIHPTLATGVKGMTAAVLELLKK
jgi:hippurate hydrolase